MKSIDRFLKRFGQKILLNGKVTKALIEDSYSENWSDRIINVKEILNSGDIITYNSSKWIVNNQSTYKETGSYEGKMRECEHLLKVYINKKLYEIPCIIETSNQSIKDGQYLSWLEGKIIVTIPKYSNLEELTRFIIMRDAWKIEGISEELKGLYKLYCSKDVFTSKDNIELGIADYWKYNDKHNYKIKINTKQKILAINQSLQLNITVLDDNVVIDNPMLTYKSSNESVCTITKTGLVTAHGVGNCDIVVSIEETEVKIRLSVQEIVEDKFILSPKGAILRQSCNQVYKVINEVTGVLSEDVWNFEALNNDGLIEIKETTNNSIKILANNKDKTGTVTIKATNGDKEIKYNLKIIGWW